MHKKIVPLAIALGFAATSSIPAYASLSFVARFSPDSGIVTLLGSGDGHVTVKIADATMTDDSFSDQNPPFVFDKIYANGDFTYVLELPDGTPAGKYAVYLRDKDGTESDYFNYFDVNNANEEIVPELNRAISEKSYDDFKEKIIQYASELGIDKDDSVYTTKASYIIKLLFDTVTSFEDASDFYDHYNMMYSIAAIDGAKKEQIESVLLKNAPIFGLDYNLGYVFDPRLNEKSRASLCNMLSEYDFETNLPAGKTFLEIFNSLKPVASISNASRWQDIEKAMETDYKSEFAFIFNENKNFTSISDLSSVYADMMNKISDIKSLDDVQKLFDSVVKAKLTPKSNPSTGSGGGKSQTVVMPMDNNDIITAVPVQPSAQKFSDVPVDYWAHEAITGLATKKVINGRTDGSFEPDGLITRAEFIKLLVSIAGYAPTDCIFEDVAKEDWYYGYIGAAYNAGVVQGFNGKVSPEAFITRQDAAVLLCRMLKQGEADLENSRSFSDEADISEYAREAVKNLSSLNIINGYSSGEFLPKNNMSRAEAAQMLYKIKF